jgi:RNA polymerase sigma factor (sigma-70 family)
MRADRRPMRLDGGDSDADVIRRSRLQPGDFAVIFRRHAPRIRRYVVRRVGPDAADDVMSETFLAAFAQRGEYQSAYGDALPWLYGIATNLIARHRRAEIRQYRALARSGSDPVMEPFTDAAAERVTASGMHRRLAAALAALPAAHRDAVLLVAWGDLTYAEVSVALGVPIGTLRSRVSGARDRLRASLADGDPAALLDDHTDESKDGTP